MGIRLLIESWEYPVMVPKPHFLLFCDGQSRKVPAEASAVSANSNSVRGRWRFILEDLEAGTRLEACDAELVQAPERAALLAVVRGLEALEQPSRVTLVTTSRYVSRGLQFGLIEWRESDYCWEHFGSVQPIRNADLWRRIDHAMAYHQIHCRWIEGQEWNNGEDATELQIEPIASNERMTSNVPIATNVAVASAPIELKAGIERMEVVAMETSDAIEFVASDVEELATRHWSQYVLHMIESPFRSLRLPRFSTIHPIGNRRDVYAKFWAVIPWLHRFTRSRKFAM